FFFSLRRGLRPAPAFGAAMSVRFSYEVCVIRGGRRKALLAPGLLLAGHGALRALAGARVRLGALTAHGQAAAVAESLVRADLDLAADVGGDLAAEVALDLVRTLDVVAQEDQLVVGQVAHADVRADARRSERLVGARAPDAVDVGECDFHPLLAGDVDAGETC